MKHCGVLIDALLDGLESRFGHLQMNERYMIASITHPMFKNHEFIRDDAAKRSWARELLSVKVEDPMDIVFSDGPEVKEDADEDAEYFFPKAKRRHVSPHKIVDSFLADEDLEDVALLKNIQWWRRYFGNTTHLCHLALK